jgi:hypothetical protein
MSGRGLAVVSAEAERVTGWVEEHSDVLLRLVRSHRCSEGNGLGDRGVEVADLEIEVHHRTLLPVDWRPYGGLVAGRLLEHDVDGSRGRGEDGRTWFLVPDRPAEQPGVEPRQCAGVRRLDGGSPPHALLPRLHLAPHSRRIDLVKGRSLTPRHDQHARSGSGRSASGLLAGAVKPDASPGNGQQDAIFEIAERGQAGRSALLPLRGRRLLVQEGEQWQVCCGGRAHRRVVHCEEAAGRGVAIPGGPADAAGPWAQRFGELVSLEGEQVIKWFSQRKRFTGPVVAC